MWLTRRHCLAVLAAAGPAILARSGDVADAAVLPDTLALRGFDAVTYFLDGEPRAGRPAFELNWRGRAWRFASAANLAVFRDHPAVYAPRLAGYDPVGVAQGRIVDADPLVFARLAHAREDRLYLFRNAEHRERARRDPGLVARAETRWPTLNDVKDPRLPD